MRCPGCGQAELEAHFHHQIQKHSLECTACDLKFGPYDTALEANVAVARLIVAIEKQNV